MKKMFLAAVLLLAVLHLTIAQNPEPGPGEKAGENIAERVESAETSSSDQKALVKEIAAAARKAGRDNPNDAGKVKEAVRKKLDEIRDRKSGDGKPGGKNNKEVEEWVKKLKRDLMDHEYVAVPLPANTALLISAKGTGRTTGHIADLMIQNPTDQAISTNIGPLFIPSGGNYQPYIVPSVTPVTIQPHSSSNIALQGYCADIFTQPVPAGADMPAFGQWIWAPGAEVLSDGWQPEVSNGWQPVPGISALVPGSNRPLGHTIDIGKHPGEAAPLLLEAVTRIAVAYDRLKEGGLITTPFSGNPEKEREAVIQQTFWKYAAGLSGKPYKRSDFYENTVKQYEAGTGQKISAAPPAVKENLDQGVVDFWNTFEAVGVEAKVLSASGK